MGRATLVARGRERVKIHYGEPLLRLMQPKETGPTTPSPAKTQMIKVVCAGYGEVKLDVNK